MRSHRNRQSVFWILLYHSIMRWVVNRFSDFFRKYRKDRMLDIFLQIKYNKPVTDRSIRKENEL